MSKQWNFLFDEGENMNALRHRRMEKTAGVFMRPSDIADHTELATSLEGLLNGQPGGRTFKDHPGEQKTAGAVDSAIGAAIGGAAGYFADNRVNPVPPPSEPSGFKNTLQQVRHDMYTFKEENPKTSKAIGVLTGAATGGYLSRNLDVMERLRKFKRGAP
jgi:hypothetical protein